MDYGYGEVGYLNALALQYREACKALSGLDEPLLESTIKRLTHIRENAQMDYGIWEYMAEVLGDALCNLPDRSVVAVAPQLAES